MLTTIPFSGFYESQLSDALDREEELIADNTVENDEGFGRSAAEIQEAMYFVTDYKKAHEHIAKEYAEQFAEYVKPYTLEFESMDSPREYNFTTDRVFMTISDKDFRAMRNATSNDIFAALVRERFTSRSGFASHYSNDWRDWHYKPLEDWDHNEVGTLLEAYLQTQNLDRCDIEDGIIEYMSCNGVFGNALDCAMDKDALTKRLKQTETV